MKQKYNIENEKIQSGFSTPDNYFNALEVNIQNRISQKTKGSFFNRYKYVLSGIAACTIGIAIWIYQPKQNVSAVPQEMDYSAYIDDNIEEFDDDLIFETYAEASSTTSARAAEDEVYSSFLIDENVDENTLIDEL